MQPEGLAHFFKRDAEWHFVTASDYEARRGELPLVCFATRNSVKEFATRDFPNLEALAAQLETSEAEQHP